MRITPVNTDKVNKGSKTKYFGVTLTIARNSSDTFKQKWATLTRPYKTQIDRSTLDEATYKDIMCEAMAGTVLLGWDEVEFSVKVGQDFPFSEANAKMLLMEDSDLREFVVTFASSLANFLEEDKIQTEGK